MNVHVSRIARRQVVIGGFSPEASPLPPLVASDFEAKDDVDNDGNVNFTNEMST